MHGHDVAASGFVDAAHHGDALDEFENASSVSEDEGRRDERLGRPENEAAGAVATSCDWNDPMA
ncbi:MAG: hypothetical protein R3D02_10715 [Hyphomicrobiales bacterium]